MSCFVATSNLVTDDSMLLIYNQRPPMESMITKNRDCGPRGQGFDYPVVSRRLPSEGATGRGSSSDRRCPAAIHARDACLSSARRCTLWTASVALTVSVADALAVLARRVHAQLRHAPAVLGDVVRGASSYDGESGRGSIEMVRCVPLEAGPPRLCSDHGRLSCASWHWQGLAGE
jgi:hypothetical protein